MIDYDMLFEEGNLVALKNMYENKIYYYFVEPYVEGEDGVDWSDFYNDNLTWNGDTYYEDENKYHDTTFQIMFIAKLDFDDKTVDVLYSRRDGINKAIKMPELKNGMFVEQREQRDNEAKYVLGVIVNNKIVYQDGEWDRCDEFDNFGNVIGLPECYITAVWDKSTLGFKQCKHDEAIWRR